MKYILVFQIFVSLGEDNYNQKLEVPYENMLKWTCSKIRETSLDANWLYNLKHVCHKDRGVELWSYTNDESQLLEGAKIEQKDHIINYINYTNVIDTIYIYHKK